MRIDPGAHVGTGVVQDAKLLQPLHDGLGDQRRVQVGVGTQQGVGRRVGHGPLAAGVVTLHLVELAHHIGPHIGAPVVQLFLELVFDDLAFFFDHQNLLQAGGEVAGQLCLQRPHHTHLVQADAELAAGGVVQAQVEQRLARVVVGLAAGHDAETVVWPLDHVVVELVGADVGQRGVPLVMHQPRFLLQRMVGPADVQTAGRHLEIGGYDDVDALGVDHRGGAGFNNLLDRLHARPHTRKTAHRKRVDTQVEDLLHVGREEHRCATGLEDVVALVRRRAALADVVVARDSDHTAKLGGARHVGVFEHVRAAVHPRALAVPDTKHTVELVGAFGREAELLRTPERGGRQLFVHTGLEHDVLRLQVLAGLPQRLVVTAER